MVTWVARPNSIIQPQKCSVYLYPSIGKRTTSAPQHLECQNETMQKTAELHEHGGESLRSNIQDLDSKLVESHRARLIS
jgi:hypothetical protein